MSVPSRVFVTREIPEATLALLAARLPEARVEVNREDRWLSHEEIAERARGAAALICTLVDPIDRELLEALAPELKVVATYAVGVDNIDLQAARDLDIRVTHTPDVLTEATAEVAVGLILACARRLVEGDRLTRAGHFRGWTPLLHRGFGVYGKTVGIIGAGRIGWRVASTMRRGFDCEILVHSTRRHRDWEEDLGAAFAPLDSVLERSDFVSLHCPLTDATRHLIDAAALERMKSTACLINTARGAIVDEAALVRALDGTRIAAAGLDVYEREPQLSAGLAALESVVVLPHIGSATHEARDAMGRLCAEAVIDVLSGREPPHALI